jgi:3-ketosteroid 9alpha-monooxygenase subunit B
MTASAAAQSDAAGAGATSQPGAVRDHGFHTLRVRRVVVETPEASSFVLDVPGDHADTFAYAAGQFLTFRVHVDGEAHHRCYSMSSAPEVDGELQVTVKRVPGGVVSNRLVDTVREGGTVEVSVPAGVFRLDAGDAELVVFAAGSGITPIISLVKSALATSDRRVRLYYANRDRDAVIFAAELDALVERHPGRLEVLHHHDVDRGFVDADAVRSFLAAVGEAEHYICGPTPFMDVVETALLDRGVAPDHIHIERFAPATPEPPEPPDEAGAATDAGEAGTDDAAPAATQVTIELDGRTETVEHRPGTTILQTARQLGMSPPYSCESGSCATCMAKLVEGSVKMHVNDVLTDDEVADGWVLTCQSVPTSPTVRVEYEGS